MLEHTSRSRDTVARAKPRELLQQGTMSESPGNIAYLVAARMYASAGDTATALDLIRRRDPMAGHMIQPEAWRLEGEWSLSRGDTVAALRAFMRHLEIRDRPDRELMAERERLVQVVARLQRPTRAAR